MQELAAKAIRGDTDAFMDLIDANSHAMYKVARGILKNDEDVADAIQDTILSCFEKIGTLRKPEFFKTWLIRILINECNEMLRKSKREYLPEQMPEPADQDRSAAEFEFNEMLNRMEEGYRLIVILYYVEGFKIQEIADLLDMNSGTVKTRLARARQQLKQIYFPEEGDAPQSSSAKRTHSGVIRITGGKRNEQRKPFPESGRYHA